MVASSPLQACSHAPVSVIHTAIAVLATREVKPPLRKVAIRYCVAVTDSSAHFTTELQHLKINSWFRRSVQHRQHLLPRPGIAAGAES